MQKYVLRKNCTARQLFKSCWGIALFDLNFNSHVFEAKQYKVLYLVLHKQYKVLSLELFFWSGIISVNWHSIICGNLVAIVQYMYFYSKNHLIAWFWFCRRKIMFPSLQLKNVWDIRIWCVLLSDGLWFFIISH